MLFIVIGLLFWGCSGGGNKAKIQSRSEQELLASFLDYHQKKDLDGMLGLFYQQDTPQFVLDSVKKRSRQNFNYAVAAAQIEEIPAEKLAKVMAGAPFNGKILVPNLTPIKQIAFKFTPTGNGQELRAIGGSIMFGKVDNICYFILSKVQADGPVKISPATSAPAQ